MANDADWVADVRRWYFSSQAALPTAKEPDAAEAIELGYEAAHPALQSRHWPDAPSGGVDLI
jgi:hypothetical protein